MQAREAQKARRALARSLIVPLLMSALAAVVFGEVILYKYGARALAGALGLVLALALAAQTGVGERWFATLRFAARRPLLHQQYTLAPLAQVLQHHGAGLEGLTLLVSRIPGEPINGYGRRTLVVPAEFVEAVRGGRLSPQVAAALIAHELGVMRAGLTRAEPALSILLIPWTIWLTFMTILWGIMRGLIPLRLIQLSFVINASVGFWRGYTEHPIHYASPAVLAVTFLVWWSIRSWARARAAVGDVDLHRTGLASAYAQFLVNNHTDDYTRNRAVRLLVSHPEPSGSRLRWGRTRTAATERSPRTPPPGRPSAWTPGTAPRRPSRAGSMS